MCKLFSKLLVLSILSTSKFPFYASRYNHALHQVPRFGRSNAKESRLKRFNS